ncbi:hypothetical protein Sme01_70830 [Sphaerisporangium melleum]|uniref:Transcriptional regulator n=1 Tax=Sphaerisporangium melleum TaxID=321316 RepID=A0A917RLZ3_9ACTN|nr:acyltransferase family protein [Sphaerisporangium melleum]GGL13959.1 hypothetical protein GCM10007964_64960 [Sphaerisporangium melleum]GII74607.1 hypothetical protein Sme01_70830 [Sphaerisporangium melleum]
MLPVPAAGMSMPASGVPRTARTATLPAAARSSDGAPSAPAARSAGDVGSARARTAAGAREVWADVAKGVCILLVVLWHVITKDYLQIDWHAGTPLPGMWGTLGDQLLTLRMPLFFTISGVFAAGALRRLWRVVARSRVARFLYLYVLWTALHTVLLGLTPGFDTTTAHGVAEFAAQLVLAPPNLWYLYALALYFTVAKALRRVPAPVMLAAALALSAVAAAGVVPPAGNRVSLLQNLLFFLAGLHLRPHVLRLAAKARGRRTLLIGAGYAVALAAMAATGAQRLPGVWPAVCVIATVFGVSAAPMVAAIPVIGAGLARLGRRTLAVYVIHMPVLALPHQLLAGPLAHAGAQVRFALAAVHPVLMTALVVALCLLLETGLRRSRALWLFDLPSRLRARSAGPADGDRLAAMSVSTAHDVPEPVTILLVEDDEVIRKTVAMALERYGYRVIAAGDGLSGLELFRERRHDLLLLDVMLPGLDGIGLCRKVRESSLAPILMMSARGDALDVVSGLEAGADDYVVKPVDISVLVARIRSLLRRATFTPLAPGPSHQPRSPGAPEGPGAPAEREMTGDALRSGAPSGGVPGSRDPSDHAPGPGDLLVFGDLAIDTAGLAVFRAGEQVALAPTELRLLLEFAANPGIVLDRRTLLREVWDYGWDGDSRVVDLCVQRLRKKIGADRIETVRGFGYKLRR